MKIRNDLLLGQKQINIVLMYNVSILIMRFISKSILVTSITNNGVSHTVVGVTTHTISD